MIRSRFLPVLFLLLPLGGPACASSSQPPEAPPTAQNQASAQAPTHVSKAIHRFPYEPAVQLRLAQRYRTGDGVETDPFLAAYWAHRAASSGHAEASTWLEQSAKKDDAFSQLMLWRLEVEANPEQHESADAKRWLEACQKGLENKAAKGDKYSQHALGVLHSRLDAATHATSSLEWFEKAANAGYTPAMVALAQIHQEAEPALAARWAKIASEKGNAEAQVLLGRYYQNGKVLEQDPKRAAELFSKAADQGYAPGEVVLGELYLAGTGVAKDGERARVLFERAAKRGFAGGMLSLAKYYGDEENGAHDDAKALNWYRRAAERGDFEAQLATGWHYEWGKGTQKNVAEAGKWYRGAAEQGNAEAQYRLARTLEREEEGTYPQAMRWYRRAADQGHTGAMVRLGVMHEFGKGTKKDLRQAVAMYRKAAEAGNALAEAYVGMAYANGDSVAKNHRTAVEWFRKSAEKNNSVGRFQLGMAYEFGNGVKKDLVTARRWYQLAADQGNANAQTNLGWLLWNGNGGPEDKQEAARLFETAAEDGNTHAQFSLGITLKSGEAGVPQDAARACRLYHTAAEQGHSGAQNNLGVCYEFGDGLTRDLSAARYWYTKSAEAGSSVAQRNLGHMYAHGNGVEANAAEAEKWYAKAAKSGDEAAKKELKALRKRRACERGASTRMFGVLIKCVDRDTFRRAIRANAAVPKRELPNYWYDVYDSTGVLSGSSILEVGYTEDDQMFGRAVYTFPAHVDTNKIVEVATLVASKRGKPSRQTGYTNVGEASYEWNLPDGIRIRVYRGWPDTTTYLEYTYPTRRRKIDREIELTEARRKAREFQRQASGI